MSLVQLHVKGISFSQNQSGAYALVLNEVNGKRTLPIIIGAFEAQAIAIALENEIKPTRPLTHDLFVNFANQFKINVNKIIIHKLVDGVFYSSLICEKDDKEEIFDTRTSDAIALAARFNVPIFTYEDILQKAGIFLKQKEEDEDDFSDSQSSKGLSYSIDELLEEEKPNTGHGFENLSDQELQKELAKAIDNEDYELAAKIRDEISKR